MGRAESRNTRCFLLARRVRWVYCSAQLRQGIARTRRMNNTERLLLHTLPRWASVPVTSLGETLTDMWVRGEDPGNHAGLPYPTDGIDQLRTELLREFVSAPS